jgi:thioredoxin 2
MIEACRACGARNRIPANRLNGRARCGTCMRTIVPLASPHEIHSVEEFEELVSSSPLPVLVDFWAPWCSPCKAVAPEVERVAKMRAGGAVIAKVNTEEVPEIANRYHVEAIPTFIVFRLGHEEKRLSGAAPADKLFELTTAA